jgi:hypothetical protein
MAKLRVTRELLEFALDLPDGVVITAISGPTTLTDGVEVFDMVVDSEASEILADGSYALGYEETESGLALTDIVAVT